MAEAATSNSRIEAAYRERTPRSARLAAEAAQFFPGGVTHDARYLLPYGVYCERGAGPRKWDVDGNEYVDYFGGHGAMLLGHAHPDVVAAVQAAVARGSHLGAGHAAEVEWARRIRELMPSAERVRFTASGTEATHMALRLARAHTGRTKLARFKAHFHGWHDHMASGYANHFDGSPAPGVLPEVSERVVLWPSDDIDAVRAALEQDHDIAAVFLEPTGATFGMVPMAPEFVRELRELTRAHGVVLVFDEVVTGFRVAPGGAQAALGVRPDLSTLAKIVAGGMPGGAVIGSRAILDRLDADASRAAGVEKILHPGTFNANPISAASGVAALGIIASTDACERANAYAARLRARLNEVLAEARVAWACYGTYSGFHLFTNPAGRDVDPLRFDPSAIPFLELKENRVEAVRKLRLALLLHGVDVTGWPGGVVSATHGERELEHTVDAFRAAFGMLREEAEL